MIIRSDSTPPLFTSACCKGETCQCGKPAAHKVEETIFADDPMPDRHPYTAYVCRSCFARVIGLDRDKVKMSVTLTLKEIKELALFAGFELKDGCGLSDEELESEITIADCPKDGVRTDEGGTEKYEHIAYFTEYPEEGCFPLGEKREDKG